MCRPGYAFKDLGKVIEDIARKRGFSVNKTYGGHGINQSVASFEPVRYRHLSKIDVGLSPPAGCSIADPTSRTTRATRCRAR